MADHYNLYGLKHFAGIVADCMGIALPEGYAPSIGWISDILRERLGGTADRAVLYHADAVGQYILQQYTGLLAPVYKYTSMAVPFISTVESVTPVAHASMYTGLDPEGHGIKTYVRPQLTCDTLFDVWLRLGKKVAIVAQKDSTFLHIFAGRDLDYFEAENGIEVQEKSLELLESDKYDVVSIHTFEYDNAAHAYGPESKEALNAVSLEAEGFQRLAEAMERYRGKHRTLLTYSPDHGQHPTMDGHGQHGSKMIEDMNIVHFFGTIA
ncbi:MAG: alkaline phosphatase family protein [Clostridia bacterium]|nr:alkaline phosphatase family protein [Clostridia bacterium]